MPSVSHLAHILIATLLTLLCASAYAEHHAPIHLYEGCAPDGVALGGYDAVSYHSEGGPKQGHPDFQIDQGGLLYKFVSGENLDAFIAEPSRYVPTYRGWCSTNLSMGRLACPDFSNFKIEQGRLLLFEQAGFTNGRDIWNSDPALHRGQADGNYIRFSE